MPSEYDAEIDRLGDEMIADERRGDAVDRGRIEQLIVAVTAERTKRYMVVKGLSYAVAALLVLNLYNTAELHGVPGVSMGSLGESARRTDAITTERFTNTLAGCEAQNKRHDAALHDLERTGPPRVDILLLTKVIDSLAPFTKDCAADTARKVKR